LHYDLSCTDMIIALQSLDGHIHGYLVYHLHKEVPLSVYVAQSACLAMRQPMQQPSI
jgi:hypothetical protein